MILLILLPIAQLAAEVTDILQIIDDIEYITQKHKEGADKLNTSLLKTLSIESVKYNKGETLVCLIENENLIIKRRVVIRKRESEDHNISMMVDHKNVVKTFLTIQAKKGDMTIEYSISPYYEEEVKMNMFESPKDLLDYLKQLATGISHLHGKNIKHGDIKIENTRLTYYNKTITAEQREFMVKSFDTLHEKTVKRPKGDSVNKTEADDEYNPNKPGNEQPEENKNGLVWLNVYKNKRLLNSVLSLGKIQKNNEPIYVLIDLDEGDYYDTDKLYEHATSQIAKIKHDIQKYELLDTMEGLEFLNLLVYLDIFNRSELEQEIKEFELWEKIYESIGTKMLEIYKREEILKDLKDLIEFGYTENLDNCKLEKSKKLKLKLDRLEKLKSVKMEEELEEKDRWIQLIEEIQKSTYQNIAFLEDIKDLKDLKTYIKNEITKSEIEIKKIQDEDIRNKEYRKCKKLEVLEIREMLKICQTLEKKQNMENLKESDLNEIYGIFEDLGDKNLHKLYSPCEIIKNLGESVKLKKIINAKKSEKMKVAKDLEAKLSPRNIINELMQFIYLDLWYFAVAFQTASKAFIEMHCEYYFRNQLTKIIYKFSNDPLTPVNPIKKMLFFCKHFDVRLRPTIADVIKDFPTEDEFKEYLHDF